MDAGKRIVVWNLNTGQTTRRFIGHTKDVLSVGFSSRDKAIDLRNTLGQVYSSILSRLRQSIHAQLKFLIADEGHTEWVSCVRFSLNLNQCKLRSNLRGQNGYVNTVTVSPDGSLCASGGKDGTAML